MTEQKKDQLEERLAALTRWEGEQPPETWKRALQSAGQHSTSFWKSWRFAALLGLLVTAIAAAALLPSVGRARAPRMHLDTSSPLAPRPVPGAPPQTVVSYDTAADGFGAGGYAGGGDLGMQPGKRARASFDGDDAPAAAPPPADAERQVVRKATMELAVADVRTAFERAAMLVSEARGEFVETSALEGEGPEARASMTLRVDAARLSAVLNELRELGEVRSEESHGEDVTSQVVDIEARLNNERRIEKELLDMAENRNEAPLKELLEVRRSVDDVRVSIERLVAQRDRLGRLVSLATVLLIIRPTDAPPPEAPKNDLGSYFGERIGLAWNGGLRGLTDTVAGALRLAVGGLVWWVLLSVAIVGTRHLWRQSLTRRAVGA